MAQCRIPLAAGEVYPGISPTKGEVVYAGNHGQDHRAGNPYGSKWGPRFGVAYQVAKKTVVRAGYGVFFAPQFALGSPVATVGFNQTTPYIASTDNNMRPRQALFRISIPRRHSAQPAGSSLGVSLQRQPALGNLFRWSIQTQNRPTSNSSPSTFSERSNMASSPKSDTSGRDPNT